MNQMAAVDHNVPRVGAVVAGIAGLAIIAGAVATVSVALLERRLQDLVRKYICICDVSYIRYTIASAMFHTCGPWFNACGYACMYVHWCGYVAMMYVCVCVFVCPRRDPGVDPTDSIRRVRVRTTAIWWSQKVKALQFVELWATARSCRKQELFLKMDI